MPTNGRPEDAGMMYRPIEESLSGKLSAFKSLEKRNLSYKSGNNNDDEVSSSLKAPLTPVHSPNYSTLSPQKTTKTSLNNGEDIRRIPYAGFDFLSNYQEPTLNFSSDSQNFPRPKLNQGKISWNDNLVIS